MYKKTLLVTLRHYYKGQACTYYYTYLYYAPFAKYSYLLHTSRPHFIKSISTLLIIFLTDFLEFFIITFLFQVNSRQVC